MDPFTQRMLERARARQEKIDQKLANSGQAVPKRKPLAENVSVLKTDSSPVKSPNRTSKDSILSPKKSIKELNTKSPRRSIQKSDSPASTPAKNRNAVASPSKPRNDFIVTKKEFRSPRSSRGSAGRRNSDVSVEINIMHRNDIQIEVQVEERDAPMGVIYDTNSDNGRSVTIKEIEEDLSKPLKTNLKQLDTTKTKQPDVHHEKNALRQNAKNRLDRLGNLYSDKPSLSSPIHRTEAQFSAGTPPSAPSAPAPNKGGKKFGRLAALADEINNWEDDLSHHNFQPEPAKKPASKREPRADSSTLDVSIHSIRDINKVLAATPSQSSKVNSRTYTKPAEHQRLGQNIVAELEGEGYRRVSPGQSRLVYDFTTESARQEPKPASTTLSAAAAPNMATMVASAPVVTKKPSIKKYKAPTPPQKEDSDSDKDKENTKGDVNLECKQNDEAPASPVVKRLAPKLNGNVDRSSVLSKAAMFEAGSPRAKEKDPAEMSLRERKALFEKNKGAVIMPKAPFGQVPSAKALHGDNKAKPQKPATPTKPVLQKANSKESKESTDDNISVSSLGGGIKDKLAALMNKEKTISEATIANKFRQEREREMEMLSNRFHYKLDPSKKPDGDHSDDESSDHDGSENVPLMGSTTSLSQTFKKPEVVANIPKLIEDKDKDQSDKVVGTQPAKRRSSQDSPVVLSVLEDVKRIKVNSKKESNGTVTAQPTLYPHLSDIETDNSRSQEEFSDCGGSSSDISPEDLNKSENWAETSFGRDVMKVVKKNRKSYKMAVRESDDSEISDDCDSELDACLDEALDDHSEGPTPPKQNKNGALSSTSFVYERAQFKSPQKPRPPNTPATPVSAPRPDKGAELVHSVSFYRRMQNASNPSTPLRIVRHCSPEREMPATPSEQPASVTTVRQRIKELQQEIVKQQTIISQASQALNLCAATVEFSGSTEQAEGERLLLLATHRRQACLHEVQRLQVEGAGPAGRAGLAALHIQGLSAPLRRDYVRQLNADGAVGHHAVCLLKCRDRVLATSMQLTKPTSSVLHFPDEIRMDGLTSDFKVTVEVYLLQASKEVLPHDVKYHITSKKSSSKLLTPKSKASALKTPQTCSPGGPQAVRSPQLQPHGYCIFALSQAKRNTFTLSKVPCGSPLEGSLQLAISARVSLPPPAPRAAFLTAFEDVSGLGAWHRRWSRLQPPTLACWKYPDDVSKKMPIGDIDLRTVTSEKVIRAPRDLCARPHTLLMETSVPAGLIVPDSGSLVYYRRPDGSVSRRHLLAADTAAERDAWLTALNDALEYVRCTGDSETEG